jgi:hypothetical protein
VLSGTHSTKIGESIETTVVSFGKIIFDGIDGLLLDTASSLKLARLPSLTDQLSVRFELSTIESEEYELLLALN